MIYYPSKKQKNRIYGHLHLNNIFEIIDHLKELPKPFVLFLCCDGSDYKEEELSEFASHIVKNGLCFLDVWGKDSTRIEFLFDKIIMSTEKSIIPTVPHDNEELEEALSFFINYSFPNKQYKNCKTWLVFTVKKKTWKNKVKKILTNVDKYYKS